MTSEMTSQSTPALTLVRLFGCRLKPPMFDPMRQAALPKLRATRGPRCGEAPGVANRATGRAGPPANAGIDRPRVSNDETQFRTTRLNSSLRAHPTGIDRCVALGKLPPGRKITGTVLSARIRTKDGYRVPTVLG